VRTVTPARGGDIASHAMRQSDSLSCWRKSAAVKGNSFAWQAFSWLQGRPAAVDEFGADTVKPGRDRAPAALKISRVESRSTMETEQ
jgi:hypothetical protein